ncbi:hypothetical protein DFH28DRAFT_395161 [Melampsora americana]|nr:hypothetical protein DFH28DRAFT_395161 [Melampsora americana]
MSPIPQNQNLKPSTPVTSTALSFLEGARSAKGVPVGRLLFSFFSVLAFISFFGLLCIVYIRSRDIKRARRKRREDTISSEQIESEYDTSAMDQEAGKVKPKKRRDSKQAGEARVSELSKSEQNQQVESSNPQHRVERTQDFTNVFGDMDPSPTSTPLEPLHFSTFIVKLPSIYETKPKTSGSTNADVRQETLSPDGIHSLSPVQSVHEKVSKPAKARRSKGILNRTDEDSDEHHVPNLATHPRIELKVQNLNEMPQSPYPEYHSPNFQAIDQKQEVDGLTPTTSNMKLGLKKLMKLVTGKSKQDDQATDSNNHVENSKAHVLKSDALKYHEKSEGKVSTVQKVDVWAKTIEPNEESDNSFCEGSRRTTISSWTNEDYSSTDASIHVQGNEEEFNLERLTSQRSKSSHTSPISTSKASMTEASVTPSRAQKRKIHKRNKDTSSRKKVVKPLEGFKEEMIPQDSQVTSSKESNPEVFRLSYDLKYDEGSQHTNESNTSSNIQPIWVIGVDAPKNTSKHFANSLPKINPSGLSKDPNVLYAADKSPLLTESPTQLTPKKSLSPLFAAMGTLPSPRN